MPVLDLRELPAYKPTLPAPIITPGKVYKSLSNMKTSKATHPSDIPSKIVKEFAFELTEPVCHIFNVCLQEGYSRMLGNVPLSRPFPKFQTLRLLTN